MPTASACRGGDALGEPSARLKSVDDGSGFHYVGPTPVIQLPLKPGPYKVRVVGKNKSALTRELKMTIIGGRDTDDGTLTWDPPKPPP